MENFKSLISVFMAFLFITIQSCKKDPLDKLPPITTVGANTFGCLVNGEAFTPQVYFDPQGPVAKSSDFYDGKAYIDLYAKNVKKDINVHLYISSEKIEEGKVYDLKATSQNYSFAEYLYKGSNDNNRTTYSTTDQTTGQVSIKFYNKTIVAGTFWFDAVNDKGEKVQVREGRFDISL